MIKNIIFDMGQVLIEWNPPRLIERMGVTGDDALLLLREEFGCAEWQGLDRGSFSADRALAGILPRLPERLHPVAEHLARAWWEEPLWPIEGMADLVREVKGLGYGVYLCSNATSCVHQYFDRIPGSECFDGMIVSADYVMLKPQHEIYELLFETYSLTPSECFFIDDNPSNVEGALLLGMPGTVFFNDMARLRRELRQAGVPVRES